MKNQQGDRKQVLTVPPADIQSLTLTMTLLTVLAGISAAQGPGTVLRHQKINDVVGGFTGQLDTFDKFGASTCVVGDLDGDGVSEIAVGSHPDDDGGPDRGAVWILFLDPSGMVQHQQKISASEGGFQGQLDDTDFFGVAVQGVGDLDGDSMPDLAVGAQGDDDGGPDRGAVWILFLNADGTVKAEQKVSDTEGGFLGQLDDYDILGCSLGQMGDLDGDGVLELAVGARLDDDGATGAGAVWILFLNVDGTVKAYTKISSTSGGFPGVAEHNNNFGSGICSLGDLDGDGVEDLAVGAVGDEDGGGRGSAWVLFLNTDGTVKAAQKISQTEGGFTGQLEPFDNFGFSVANLGDVDDDGTVDLGVGAYQDDDGGADRGAVYLLFLNPNGTVKCQQKISDTEGGFDGGLDDSDLFGSAMAGLGDLDGDGKEDVLIGAACDDDGAPFQDHGAVWILFLEKGSDASSQVRNGSGVNPLGFAEVTPAISGTSWQTTVDIVTPGAIASLVSISKGGPLPGITTPFGELLCSPPFFAPDIAFGAHAVEIPCEGQLVGRTLSTQASTVSLGPFTITFNNAIDITIGTH